MKHSKVLMLPFGTFLPTSEDSKVIFLEAIIDIIYISVVQITSRNFQGMSSHPTNIDYVPKAQAR